MNRNEARVKRLQTGRSQVTPHKLGEQRRLPHSSRKANPLGKMELVVFALLSIWLLLELSLERRPYFLPSYGNMVIFFICVYMLRIVQSRLSFYVASFWLIWFVIGSISMWAANEIGREQYRLDVANANYVYLLGTLALILGMALAGACLPRQDRLTARALTNPHPVITYGLLALPLLYTTSVYQGTGDFPLFSGRVLSEAMYQVSYGPFHRFGIVLAITSLLLFKPVLFPTSKVVLPKTLGLVLILPVLIASMIDGRRVLGIVSILAMTFAYLSTLRSARQYLVISFFIAASLGSYLFVEEVRSARGAAAGADEWYMPFFTVGVEFRDFVYSFETFTKLDLDRAGYDWFVSTGATLVPTPLDIILNIDKDAAVLADSARSLMRLFGITLGIRIGIIGELWFACQWFALPLLLVFGGIIRFVDWLTLRSRSFVSYSIGITVISLFALSVLGQSTVTFGTIPTLAYLYVATKMLQMRMKTSS